MRALQIITDRDRRGAQVFATDLAEGLVELGAVVDTIALTKGTHGDLLPLETLGPSRRSISTFRELRRRAEAADIVIAHGSSTLFACAVALVGTRTPFIYRQISDPTHWAASWRRRLRVAMLIRRAAGIVVLSPSAARVFGRHYRLGARRMTVIPNAVPGAGFAPATGEDRHRARISLGLPEDTVVIVYVGALAEEKGVDVAIRSMASIGGSVLLVVGDGPERTRLEELASRQAPDQVFFTGSLSSPVEALAAADILVLPSRGGDSMPAVLIEAGLCGLPAVTTPVGAIADVVIDGATGRVLPIDDQDRFTAAVTELSADAEMRCRYGQAAHAHCRTRFTIEVTAPLWLDLLKSIVG